MPSYTFTVNVEVERLSGKFASREEVVEGIMDAIEQADPGSVDGIGADGDSEYEVISWEVEEVAKR